MWEFYEYYFMGKPAPKWLKEGIPHLKMKDTSKSNPRRPKDRKAKEKSKSKR